MPRKIRFHLDETCRRAIADGLRLHGVDITTTPEAKLLTVADPEQLAYAVAQGRVFYTHDAHFTDPARTGFEHPGIIYSHQHLGKPRARRGPRESLVSLTKEPFTASGRRGIRAG